MVVPLSKGVPSFSLPAYVTLHGSPTLGDFLLFPLPSFKTLHTPAMSDTHFLQNMTTYSSLHAPFVSFTSASADL